MITEQATRIIVLQLTDELLTQLRPFMEGLDITTTLHSEWAYQEIYEHGQFVGYAKVEHSKQRLTMRGEIYDALIERVGGALDYDVRWQPNEYEPDGFIERVRPLQLTNGNLSRRAAHSVGHTSSPEQPRSCARVASRSPWASQHAKAAGYKRIRPPFCVLRARGSPQ